MWIRRLAVCFGALILYLLCLDRGASLWDCPEYILIAWRMEIGHPPGNPTWQLIANVVSHLGGSAEHAAVLINAMSAISMAMAATFISEVAYMFVRGALFRGSSAVNRIWANVCAGAGALCFAWCDSAIFSAVEAEVYALSAMLTAAMLWLSLLWAQKRKKGEVAASRRLLILTAYLAGLGVGVHELNFLILPAMAMIYWWGSRKYPVLRPQSSLFKNILPTDGLPTALFGILLFAIGCTTYLILPLRASANPPINQGDPSTAESFKSYYAREQYGSKPLLYGPTPYSKPILLEQVDSATGEYLYNFYYLKEKPNGKKEYVYPEELNMWFPRITSPDPADIEFYESWAGMTPEEMVEVDVSVAADSTGNQMGKMNPNTGRREKAKALRPTYLQQVRYMLGYQVGFMYFRYLLWNFSGRQNNIRGGGGPSHGNFITGIPAADDLMLGPQSQLPPSLREENKGYNRYFMIPLFMGILGIIVLLRNGRKGRRICTIVAVFFLFTGVLIAVYLNQDPGEPRDRDYSFLGSYMAYAIWIACGMAGLVKYMLAIKAKGRIKATALKIAAAAVCAAVPLQMLSQTYDDHDRSHNKGAKEVAEEIFQEVEPGAILIANGDNAIFPLWYAQEVLGMRRDVSIVAEPYLATEWYRSQLRRPGEGAPGVEIDDTIPPGAGSFSERAIRSILHHNDAGRPVYRVRPGSEPIRIDSTEPEDGFSKK